MVIARLARMHEIAQKQHEKAALRFDRGTLHLDASAEGVRELAAALPELSWDPRTQSYRAPAWLHGALMKRARALGLPIGDDVVKARLPGAWSEIELRPYQHAALAAWEAAARRGVVVLPTGAGKTRVALAAMKSAGAPTLCLVPTRALMHQWRREVGQFYRGSVGAWGDGERELAPITISTFESAYRHMAEWGGRFRMLVVDEAHHFGNGARDEALEMSIAGARLGLTATPHEDPLSQEGLVRQIGPVVFSASALDLSGTYLASFDLIPIHVELTDKERAAYEKQRAAFAPFYKAFRRQCPEAAWKDFVAAAMESHQGRAALAAWRQARRIIAYPDAKARAVDALLDQHRTCKVLIFTSDNRTAYHIARQHLVMPFTCDLSRPERDACLERFRSGELNVLVSTRVLNEGIDVPDAEVGIVVGGAQGPREHVQRVGRLLRARPGKRATIYELVANDTTEARAAQERRRALGFA